MKKHFAAWLVVALLVLPGVARAEGVEITGYVDGDFQAMQATNTSGDTEWNTSFGDASKAFFWFTGEPSEKVSAVAGLYYWQSTNAVTLEQALVDWHIAEDTFVARFGKFYFPFGIEMRSAHSCSNKLVSRPANFEAVLDNGVGMLGAWKPEGGDMSLNWDVAVTNGLGAGMAPELVDATNNNKGIAGRVCFMPMSGLEVGGSGAWGKYDVAAENAYILAGGHAVYTGVENLDVRGEFRYMSFANAGTGGDDLKAMGGYGQVAYKVMPEGLEFVELAGRFAWFDQNTDAEDDQVMQVAGGVTVSPAEHLLLKGEFQYNKEGDAYYWSPGVMGDIDNNAVLLQAVFSFK
jgi:hypothetical protein